MLVVWSLTQIFCFSPDSPDLLQDLYIHRLRSVCRDHIDQDVDPVVVTWSQVVEVIALGQLLILFELETIWTQSQAHWVEDSCGDLFDRPGEDLTS